jgi:phosphoribosylanthranilate isomerase
MSIAVKTCGLSDKRAIDAALAGGARYLGFVFFPPSPRNVAPAEVAALVAALPEGVSTVGVTVDPDDALLDKILSAVRVDYFQLHGNESPERAQAIRQRTGCGVIKAIKVSEAAEIGAAEAYREATDMVLFDAKPPPDAAHPGGNARAFDWSLFQIVPPPPSMKWLLSGGLTVDNVAEAIKIAGARAVDVSSGIESAPGRKDPNKIRAFLDAVATADSHQEQV